jgi:hypothetical protein
MRTAIIAAAAAALLGGCALERRPEDRAALAAAEAAGPPVDCVALRNIDYTRVRDDRTIDFYMVDRTVYRNVLRDSCPGLGFDGSFGYSTSTGQLCSVDTIRLRGPGGTGGPTCGLGAFRPIRTSIR